VKTNLQVGTYFRHKYKGEWEYCHIVEIESKTFRIGDVVLRRKELAFCIVEKGEELVSRRKP
jgi:hypothetical protein